MPSQLKISSLKYLIFYFLFLGSFLCFSEKPEVLIIQSSDQHSSYTYFPQFLASIEHISRQFRRRFSRYETPAKPILIINGDLTAHPMFWSPTDKNLFKALFTPGNADNLAFKDRGNIFYKILAELTKKYTVVFTPGNHDAFDWSDPKLFLQQMQILKNAGVHIVAANMEFEEKYAHLFDPYVDIEISEGKILRIAGLTRPYVKSQDTRISKQSPFIVKGFKNTNTTLKEIVSSTKKDPEVQSLILAIHYGLIRVKRIMRDHLELDHTIRQKLQVVYAAHDHRIIKDRVRGVPIIDSGSFFQFSTTYLDGDLNYLPDHQRFYHQEKQKKLALHVRKNSLEFRLIKKMNKFINQMKKENRQLATKQNNNSRKRKSCPSAFK